MYTRPAGATFILNETKRNRAHFRLHEIFGEILFGLVSQISDMRSWRWDAPCHALVHTSRLIANIHMAIPASLRTDVRTDVGIDPWPWKRCGVRGRQATWGGWWREGSPISRREGENVERDGSLGDCCAVATSLVVEASRVHPTGMVPLFLPLPPLPSVPSCSISCQPSRALPLRYYCRLRSSTLSNFLSRFDWFVSPFYPLLSLSLAPNPRSHPVSPTMLPVSLSRRVALQKQAYGYPQ